MGFGSGPSTQGQKLHWNQLRGCIFVSLDRTTTDSWTLLPHSTRGRVLQKALSQEVSWSFRSYCMLSVITVTSINNKIMPKISHLSTILQAYSLRTHTEMQNHPLLQNQQVKWVCNFHWISFLKAAAERQAAGCCLTIQLVKGQIKYWKTHLCCQKSDEWRRTFLLPPQAPAAHAMSVTCTELRASLPFPSQILSRCEQQN